MMDEHDAEQELRRALEQRASEVQPRHDDVTAIEAATATERARLQRRRTVLAVAAAVVVVGALGAFLTLGDDDGEGVVTDTPSTTTTEAPTTTTTTEAPTTTTSTTTTVPIDDDGVPGWPGSTSRVFDSPEAAALAFGTDVLGFADATLAEGTTEGDEAEYVVHPNPNAAISTRIHLHHTGEVRGWVVTGSAGSEGTIDQVTGDGGAVTISGSATGFEATVVVLLLDLEGNVLAESFTMAGSGGELGPYTTTIGPPAGGTAHYVAIAAGDESGEGRLLWATVVPIAP